MTTLTEERVRQIVREEIQRFVGRSAEALRAEAVAITHGEIDRLLESRFGLRPQAARR